MTGKHSRVADLTGGQYPSGSPFKYSSKESSICAPGLRGFAEDADSLQMCREVASKERTSAIEQYRPSCLLSEPELTRNGCCCNRSLERQCLGAGGGENIFFVDFRNLKLIGWERWQDVNEYTWTGGHGNVYLLRLQSLAGRAELGSGLSVLGVVINCLLHLEA